MPETWAIILAAGKSARMTVNKLLLPFNGESIIETAINHVLQSEIDHILVVLGAFHEETGLAVSRLPVQVCYNKEYEKGMLSSVQCGFRNIPVSADAVLVYQGDQPLIPGEVANRLISSWQQSGKGIVVPVYRGKRGHPLLIAGSYREEVMNLSHDVGLRALLQKFPEDVLGIDMDIPGIILDMDTLKDYLNVLQSN